MVTLGLHLGLCGWSVGRKWFFQQKNLRRRRAKKFDRSPRQVQRGPGKEFPSELLRQPRHEAVNISTGPTEPKSPWPAAGNPIISLCLKFSSYSCFCQSVPMSVRGHTPTDEFLFLTNTRQHFIPEKLLRKVLVMQGLGREALSESPRDLAGCTPTGTGQFQGKQKVTALFSATWDRPYSCCVYDADDRPALVLPDACPSAADVRVRQAFP